MMLGKPLRDLSRKCGISIHCIFDFLLWSRFPASSVIECGCPQIHKEPPAAFSLFVQVCPQLGLAGTLVAWKASVTGSSQVATCFGVFSLLDTPLLRLWQLLWGVTQTWLRHTQVWQSGACNPVWHCWVLLQEGNLWELQNSVSPVQQDASPAGLWREAERFFKSYWFVLSRLTAKLHRDRKEMKFFGSYMF